MVLLSTLKLLQKSSRSTENRITFSRSCEKPKCLPGNNQLNCSIDEHFISNIFLNPYNFWDMVPAALMSFSHTNDRYSMSNHHPQPTTHQPRTNSYPVCSLHCERWTVKGRDCASALLSFKENTHRTDE